MKNEIIARFSNVSKIYKIKRLYSARKSVALKNFSFDIKRGEIIGLLGLNGAGKTTIMKLLAGLIFPDFGEILIGGIKPILSEAKQKIGFLPELPYFYPHMTCLEILTYYAKLSGLKGFKEEVNKIIEKVGLTEHVSKKISEYSKGMMQRLGLAQAILHEPELLILDEPVSGLDPLAIHEVRNLIAGINKDGTTVFLSSHSISELEKICHRVIILSRGEIVKTVLSDAWKIAGGLEEIFIDSIKGNNDENRLITVH
ncbi:MAG: ABC transporter ATP-binding protein [Elusimicrobia bacterium]|nr:ABC transporter ATP-binding protein [Elusimicrobiota bacterium]